MRLANKKNMTWKGLGLRFKSDSGFWLTNLGSGPGIVVYSKNCLAGGAKAN